MVHRKISQVVDGGGGGGGNNNNNNNNGKSIGGLTAVKSSFINSNLKSNLNSSNSNTITIIISIIFWYIFSISISLYNKWMFNPNLQFSFPIIITSFHQLILFLLSGACLLASPTFRLNKKQLIKIGEGQQQGNSSCCNYPIVDNIDENMNDINLGGINGVGNNTKELESIVEDEILDLNQVPLIPTTRSYLIGFKTYMLQIFPCSLSSAADIGFGNFSFKFITLSLYTMVKSSSIVFVLLWGIVFKLEKMSGRLLSIVFIMTIGVIMMVWGQQKNDTSITNNLTNDDEQKSEIDLQNRIIAAKIFFGCLLVLFSSCMSGLRWALTQILLKKNIYTKNPILTIFYLSPSMFLTLLIVGTFIEGFQNFLNSKIWLEKGILTTIILIIIPGILAFLMTLSEFTLLQHANLLTLSISGIFKELLTITISSFIFGDRLNLINCIGLLVTLLDIFWYNYHRYEESLSSGEKKEFQYDRLDDAGDNIELRNV
ncbi:hypothetical protein PACTADRAFT_49913 [Pachysolen tannophilus NRRL Y-2460]|uniref:GDP-mannose transporter n=1 Tax=Pachysolen tannophilus NRRL Y-2460 TaxID=669874 RepID=A0A1E4TTV2_PACTA|nr:hypothetical protein PACTADRAFT_49913 [Pachysolen tannophilus NRRL Y-2460]